MNTSFPVDSRSKYAVQLATLIQKTTCIHEKSYEHGTYTKSALASALEACDPQNKDFAELLAGMLQFAWGEANDWACKILDS